MTKPSIVPELLFFVLSGFYASTEKRQIQHCHLCFLGDWKIAWMSEVLFIGKICRVMGFSGSIRGLAFLFFSIFFNRAFHMICYEVQKRVNGIGTRHKLIKFKIREMCECLSMNSFEIQLVDNVLSPLK